MKKKTALLIVTIPMILLSGCVVLPDQPHSRADVGGSVAYGDDNSFYFSLGEYYHVLPGDVFFIHDRRIPDPEIPVVLFISQRARVSPSVVINLRLSGISWMDIGLRYGLGPDIYYVPVQNVYGPSYGHAYSHYQNRNHNEWQTIRLGDDDVVNLVNLRFISERYRYPPEDVMRMHASGINFVNINDEVRQSNRVGEYRQQDRRDAREPVIPQGVPQRTSPPPERRDAREPVIPQGVQQRASPPPRRDAHELVMPQGVPQRASPPSERRDAREPVTPQGVPQRTSPSPERRDAHEPVMPQGVPQSAGSQKMHKDAQDAVQHHNRNENLRKRGAGDDVNSSEQPDKKEDKGAGRTRDEGQPH